MIDFVISDLHLGHEGILKYRTQFPDVKSHDDYIIKQWNSVVGEHDKVYILGDVAWKKRDLSKLSQMNGTKILIAGNHDILGAKNYLKYFKDIRGFWKKDIFWLSHAPIHEDELRKHINIHGHLHNKRVKTYFDLDSALYINVCCECVDYTPVKIEDIKNGISKDILRNHTNAL